MYLELQFNHIVGPKSLKIAHFNIALLFLGLHAQIIQCTTSQPTPLRHVRNTSYFCMLRNRPSLFKYLSEAELQPHPRLGDELGLLARRFGLSDLHRYFQQHQSPQHRFLLPQPLSQLVPAPVELSLPR